jgi:hypothetical protein
MRKRTRKPTGQTGPIRVSEGEISWEKIKLSQAKEEIEMYFAKRFVANEKVLQQTPFRFLGEPIPNQQNDLDFRIRTANGFKYMELMEAAPLESLMGGYEIAPSSYKPYDFASYIVSKIMGKSNAYAPTISRGILLLVYTTDWKFFVSDSTITLLQYWTCKTTHRFEGIFWYSPLDQENGVVHLIYPTPPAHWKRFDPKKYRNNVVHNADPGSATLITEKRQKE